MQPIYIEVNDEITTVIGRMKEASDVAVALVVPRGAILLQSSVNLKLARKAAADAGKELSIITTDKIGKNLAAQVGIPVFARLDAKNQPESDTTEEAGAEEPHVIAGVKVHRYYENNEEAAPEDGTGSDAAEPAIEPIVPKEIMKKAAPIEPVSDATPIVIRVIETTPLPAKKETVAETVVAPVVTVVPPRAAAAGITRRAIGEHPTSSATPAMPSTPRPAKARTARLAKRVAFSVLYLIILLALVGAGIGAYYYPKTSVVVSVKTDSWSQDVSVAAVVGSEPSADGKTVGAQLISTDTTDSLTFTASGTKDVGDTAKGTAKLINDYSTNSQAVPAGSHITAEGVDFTTDAAATVPGFTAPEGDKIPGTATVNITAANSGSNGNQSNTAGTITSPSTKVYAKIVSTTGGSSKQVKVITASDIANAKAQLIDKIKGEVADKMAAAVKDKNFAFDDQKDVFTLTDLASSVSSDTQSDSGSVTAKATLKRLVADKETITQAAKNQASAGQRKPETTVAVSNAMVGKAEVSMADNKIVSAFTVTGTTTPTLSTDSLPKQLTGKNQADAKKLIEADINGNPYVLTQTPAWWPLHNLPLAASSIKVTQRHE